jgi:4-alpha-glucanotransferase
MTTPFAAASPLFRDRRAGVLLHPTSLPGARGGWGDLGATSRQFLGFLAGAGCTVWQMLPIGPTHGDRSPYQSLSVHAGNADLISLDDLVERGWLAPAALGLERTAALAHAAADFHQVLRDDADLAQNFVEFCGRHAAWLEDYALFVALREAQGGASWHQWPEPLRRRDAAALAQVAEQQRERRGAVRFEQFVFALQWHELRSEAHRLGIYLFGDMPIFVAHDSADVWARQDLFRLDQRGLPSAVAGVPPDYFSATGQRWGNPHYDWERMQAQGFDWWLGRLRTQLEYFDLVRVDHFRGFEACWEIPGDAVNAVEGHWVKAPGEALLDVLCKAHPELPLVAENLGMITPEVEALRNQFKLPGMLILQFAFDGSPHNPYLPHRHDPLEVVYTGTHDNDTTLGWYNGLDPATRERVNDYLGRPQESMPWPLLRAALASVARLAIIPMQDLLGLDGAHRMNVPGTSQGNWRWQFDWQQVPHDLQQRLRHLFGLYGRLPAPP